jgi:poly(hydroxyalkanoate) depolymerase family esterase
MLSRLATWFQRLRTWLAVRLGLWRGQWRRGQVGVPDARLVPTLLANDTWSYGLYCPTGLRDDAPAPLIVLLHGCKQRALGFAQASGFTRAAERERVRLLCPEQRTRANLWRCWNWFVPAAQRGAGELLVVRAMLADVRRRVAIAPRGVWVVGLSAGGGLASLLAFHAPDDVDAVVAVAAPPLLGRANTQDPREVLKTGLQSDPLLALNGAAPVAPLMIVHGRADTVVAPRCAEHLHAQALKAHARSGVALQKIDAAAADRGSAAVDYAAADRLVHRLLWIDTLGHAWSGAPGGHPYVETAGAPLTAIALQFLRRATEAR